MKPYTLYTARRSGAAAVEVMLAALGLEHALKDATPWSEPPGACFDELKAVNPLGQLPTLITPGGEVLTESVAILWTLMERHPSRWVPAVDNVARAACLRAMAFAAASVYCAVGVADYPARWTTATDETSRQSVQDAALARIRVGWDTLAAMASPGPYFLGDEPRVCDVYLSNLSRWWNMREYLATTHPALHATMRRIDALDDVAPVWARHWDDTAVRL